MAHDVPIGSVPLIYRERTPQLLLLLLCSVAVIWFAAPALSPSLAGTSGHARLLMRGASGQVATQNSLLVAIAAATMAVLLAVPIGWHLQVAPRSLERMLPLMMFPFVVGTASSAFVAKLFLARGSNSGWVLANHDRLWILLVSAVFYAIHYSLPLGFFLYLGMRRTPRGQRELLAAYQASDGEEFHLLASGEFRNSAAILAFIVACFVYHDSAAGGVLFTPSEGTSTQTVSWWILNTYRRLAASDPARAAEIVLRPALLASCVAVVAGSIAALASYASIHLAGQCAAKWPRLARRNRRYAGCVAAVCCLLLLPYAMLLRYLGAPNEDLILEVVRLLPRCIVTAACLSALIWIVAAIMRLSLNSRRKRSIRIVVVALACCTYSIAPFGLAFASHYWVSRVPTDWPMVHAAALSLSLSGYFLPMMSALVLPVLWGISDEEVFISRAYGTSVREFLINSVGRRFAVDILVVLVLLFAMCACEAPITSMYSVWCGSLWELVGSRISGRGSDFHEAATVLCVLSGLTGALAVSAARVLGRRSWERGVD